MYINNKLYRCELDKKIYASSKENARRGMMKSRHDDKF